MKPLLPLAIAGSCLLVIVTVRSHNLVMACEYTIHTWDCQSLLHADRDHSISTSSLSFSCMFETRSQQRARLPPLPIMTPVTVFHDCGVDTLIIHVVIMCHCRILSYFQIPPQFCSHLGRQQIVRLVLVLGFLSSPSLGRSWIASWTTTMMMLEGCMYKSALYVMWRCTGVTGVLLFRAWLSLRRVVLGVSHSRMNDSVHVAMLALWPMYALYRVAYTVSLVRVLVG